MTYEEALKSNTRKRIYKIEWMDRYENIVDEIIGDIIDGTISCELKDGVRRTCNLTLKNDNKKYIPSEDGLIWISNRFKLYTGLESHNQWNPQGVFVLGNPSVNSNFADTSMSIEAVDKFALLNGELAGKLEGGYIINLGEKISNAVRAVIADAGMPETRLIISPTIEVTPYTLVAKPGESYADILFKLAEMINFQIYFDVNGNLVFEPVTDEKNKGSIWTFHKKEVTYLGSTHNYDFKKMRNYVVVYGDNINGYQIKGVASDTNEFSPTNTDKVGKRVEVIEDDIIFNDFYAVLKAEYHLKDLIQLYESVDNKAIPIDIIQEGDIIEIEDDSNGLNRDRYLVRNVNMPLNHNSEMTLSVWKTRDIITISNAVYNYYISTTGSDLNDGLTESTPFKTWAKCASVLPEINNYTINVYFAPGDYHSYEMVILIDNFYGTGSINLLGDTGNPQNYIIGNVKMISNTCTIKIQGFTIVTPN